MCTGPAGACGVRPTTRSCADGTRTNRPRRSRANSDDRSSQPTSGRGSSGSRRRTRISPVRPRVACVVERASTQVARRSSGPARCRRTRACGVPGGHLAVWRRRSSRRVRGRTPGCRSARKSSTETATTSGRSPTIAARRGSTGNSCTSSCGKRRTGQSRRATPSRFGMATIADIREENLELVTRADVLRRNSVHNLPKELATTIQLLGALKRQIRRRSDDADDHEHDQRSA